MDHRDYTRLVIQGDNANPLHVHNMYVTNKKESYMVILQTLDETTMDHLEVAKLQIAMFNENTWFGTIQDFKAIFSIVENTLNSLKQDLMYGSEQEQTEQQLEYILSLYRKQE